MAKKRTCKTFDFDSYGSATTPQKCFLLMNSRKRENKRKIIEEKKNTEIVSRYFCFWERNRTDQSSTFNKPNSIEFDLHHNDCLAMLPENYTKKFVTYGSGIFVSFPIISTKLLSQSFFLSKLNVPNDSMICRNEM